MDEKLAALDEVATRKAAIGELENKLAIEATHKDNALEEIQRFKDKNARMQQLLDESRKNEAYLKQKLSSIVSENTEAMEGEQEAQEAIGGKLEEARIELREKKKEVDKLQKMHDEYVTRTENEHSGQLSDKIIEVEERLTIEYTGTIRELKGEVNEKDHELDKAGKKLELVEKEKNKFEEKFNDEKGKKLELVEQVAGLQLSLAGMQQTSEVDAKVSAIKKEQDVDQEEVIRQQTITIEELNLEVDTLKTTLAKTKFQSHHGQLNEEARRGSVNISDVSSIAEPTTEDAIVMQTQMSLLMDKLDHQAKNHDRHKIELEESHRQDIERHKKEIESHKEMVDKHKMLFEKTASELELVKEKHGEGEEERRGKEMEIQRGRR